MKHLDKKSGLGLPYAFFITSVISPFVKYAIVTHKIAIVISDTILRLTRGENFDWFPALLYFADQPGRIREVRITKADGKMQIRTNTVSGWMVSGSACGKL